jgi:hypothetical protein
MTRQAIDRMLLELIGAIDYDIAKSFDPECAEEPESIPQRMTELRRIVTKHMRVKERKL